MPFSPVDFESVVELQEQARWHEAGDLLVEEGRRLEAGGAQLLLLCTNTMHRVAGRLEADLDVPLLHIADAVGDRLEESAVTRVGLLGTRYTMEQPFYRERLRERFGLEVLVPTAADRAEVHRIIFDELCLGRIEDASRAEFVRVIRALASSGAEAVVLGCTEIGLLVSAEDVDVALLDSTEVHAAAAVERAL